MKEIKINFYIDRTRANASGKVPVMLRSRHNSDKLIVKSTGEFCNPWPEKYGSVCNLNAKNKKDRRPNDDVIVSRNLEALQQKIEDTYRQLSSENDGTTLADVWAVLYPAPGTPPRPKTAKIVDWIDTYIEKSIYSDNYKRGAKQIRLHLCGWYSEKGRIVREGPGYNPNMKFADLNQSTVDGLVSHMIKNGKAATTISRVLKYLRQVAKLAGRMGVKVGDLAFTSPKHYSKKVRTSVRLNFGEIRKIQNLRLPEGSPQETIRDMFVLQCFSGLRHSDAINLIKDNAKNPNYLEVFQQKTDTWVYPTVNPYSRPLISELLKKADTGTTLLFKRYTQQFYNRALKEICKQAGLDDEVRVTRFVGSTAQHDNVPKYKLIGSHTARRSYARMLANIGVPTEIIGEELGHVDVSITAHYVGTKDHDERIKLVTACWQQAERKFAELEAQSIMNKNAA